jgi:hypothetical protein
LFQGRKSFGAEIVDFKTLTINNLVEGLQRYEIILVGDNGQDDIIAYDNVKKAFPKMENKIHIYIHQIYGTGIKQDGMTLEKGQIPYLTAADLAVEFFKNGWIDEADLRNISEIVLDALSSGDSDDVRSIIPKWAKSQCIEFASAYTLPELDIEDDLKYILNSVVKKVKNLCGVKK